MEEKTSPQELLVIVTREQTPKLMEQIAGEHLITQAISSRLFVIELRESTVATLRAVPGLRIVVPGEQPREELSHLDETERLFAEAWISRMTGLRSKKRIGEGLPWDAPGVVPPDRPKQQR